MDGTFSFAPQLFYQLLTIHGIFEDGYRLPLFHALLPGKKQHHYTTLFKELEAYGVEPDSLLCDSERGSRCLAKPHPTRVLLPLPPSHPAPLQLQGVPSGAGERGLPHSGCFPEDCCHSLRLPRRRRCGVASRALKPTLPSDLVDFVDYYERTASNWNRASPSGRS